MCIYNPKLSGIASLFGLLYYSQNHSNFSISKNCLILIGQYLYLSPFNLLYTARSVKTPPVSSSPARSMPSSRKPRRWVQGRFFFLWLIRVTKWGGMSRLWCQGSMSASANDRWIISMTRKRVGGQDASEEGFIGLLFRVPEELCCGFFFHRCRCWFPSVFLLCRFSVKFFILWLLHRVLSF